MVVNGLSQSQNTFTKSSKTITGLLYYHPTLQFSVPISMWGKYLLLMGQLTSYLIRRTFMYNYLHHHTGAVSTKEIGPEFWRSTFNDDRKCFLLLQSSWKAKGIIPKTSLEYFVSYFVFTVCKLYLDAHSGTLSFKMCVVSACFLRFFTFTRLLFLSESFVTECFDE